MRRYYEHCHEKHKEPRHNAIVYDWSSDGRGCERTWHDMSIGGVISPKKCLKDKTIFNESGARVHSERLNAVEDPTGKVSRMTLGDED